MKRILTVMAAAAAILVPGAAQAQDDTQITLLQGNLNIAVDVVVDGAPVITDLAPGTTQDLTASAGQTLTEVEFIDSADGANVLTVPSLQIPASGNWTMVFQQTSTAPALSTFENNTSENPADQGRFVFRHTAAGGAIDLYIDDSLTSANIQPGAQVELQLPVGNSAQIELAPTGTAPEISLPEVNITATTSNIFYAIGDVDDATTVQFVSQVIDVPGAAPTVTTTTVDPNATTTTTDPNATTTTSTTDPNATTTTSTTSTTTTIVAAPTGVNTGSPIDNSVNVALIAAAVGALALTGGALVMRRRTEP